MYTLTRKVISFPKANTVYTPVAVLAHAVWSVGSTEKKKMFQTIAGVAVYGVKNTCIGENKKHARVYDSVKSFLYRVVYAKL